MRKHPLLLFLGIMAIGTLITVLIAPGSGKEFRRRSGNDDEDDDLYWEGVDTFNISELIAEGSDSLEQIKQRIEAEK
ncbi:MAG: YtxH domain-containing protein [Chitinophagales bacterium]|jgi:gas vesicle protein|nr:YtxH domain-containing protein [Chitinophagales bacterium]